MTTFRLPGIGDYRCLGAPALPADSASFTNRVAFAAAHVVADPAADSTSTVDWTATLRFRHHLWSLGLGVAEAMDTAQRGMGLTWDNARELIQRSGAEAASVGGKLACGAGTDQLTGPATVPEVLAAYEEQIELVEAAGAQVILMASPALAAAARGPEDYLAVYGKLLAQTKDPVILHWLGPMFAPALSGYWGSADLDVATDTLLELLHANASKVDGVKLSLLDADRERTLRAALPDGVRMYTGDDFNYADLIAEGSDALLGIFDPIAPIASAALRALDDGDDVRYAELFAPTIELSRLLFAEPTYHYKTGVVFLAWLTGHQDHFLMVGGQQGARSLPHLAKVFVLADRAGLFTDPDLAADRLRQLLSVAGLL
ncbi:MAG TPA: dihydrodipicolinate synthase family protein [Pseudonocardiaceae bacterium]